MPSKTSEVADAVLGDALRDEAGGGEVGRHADGLEDGSSALSAGVGRVVGDVAFPELDGRSRGGEARQEVDAPERVGVGVGGDRLPRHGARATTQGAVT